jgi:hypothetical protein
MYYEKVGIAILRPKLFENKLHSFDVELIKSEDITPQSCKKKGGKWIEDPTGKGCHFEFTGIIDASMDDIVFGRLFTDKTAPEEFVKTDEYAIKAKRGPRFQFDCGQDTSDLNVKIEHAPPPTPYMKRHYLKYLDMACGHPPKGVESFGGIVTKSDKGIAGAFFPGAMK